MAAPRSIASLSLGFGLVSIPVGSTQRKRVQRRSTSTCFPGKVPEASSNTSARTTRRRSGRRPRWSPCCASKRYCELKMRNLHTHAARLSATSIEGTRPTLQDTTVAASLYLTPIEETFADAGQLLGCYAAWLRHRSPDPDQYSRGDSDLSTKWEAAHHAADRTARAWLRSSEPIFQVRASRGSGLDLIPRRSRRRIKPGPR